MNNLEKKTFNFWKKKNNLKSDNIVNESLFQLHKPYTNFIIKETVSLIEQQIKHYNMMEVEYRVLAQNTKANVCKLMILELKELIKDMQQNCNNVEQQDNQKEELE